MLKQSLVEGFTLPLLPVYLNQIWKAGWQKVFAENGFTAPLCWYKVLVKNIQFADDDSECTCLPLMMRRC